MLTMAILILWGGTTVQAQTITPTLTPTPIATTQGTVLYNTNLRSGPGVAHAALNKVRAGQTITISATSKDGNWYEVGDGEWLATFFVAPSSARTPTTTAVAPRRLVATATAALSITQTVTATPAGASLGRSLFATATPTVTGISSTRIPSATAAEATTASTALRNANLRAGPGTNYAVTGGVSTGDALDLQGRTSDDSWFQLRDGSWIAAFLVEQNVPINATALPTVAPTVIAGIPTTVPTTVPTSTPIPQPTAQPTQPLTEEVAPVEAVPPTPTAEPNEPTSSGTTTFVVTRRRLWNPWENGGSTDGPSVHCGQGRTLVVTVLDEFGGRLNNVAVQAEYGAKEVWVTGSQGKGDGIAEFVLGGGQDVRVIRDADGSPVSSEVATGLSTDPRGIDQESLISAGYCQDDDSCRTFVNNLSCISHYSWSVTFERRR